jgi:hypothetical protein
MIDIRQVVALQNELVARWHIEPIFNSLTGTLGIVCEQHRFNFLLWHEEDIARNPLATASEIADVKRAIDRYNQKRNDWIEKIDDQIADLLANAQVTPEVGARSNTETPGSAIDRLSIMALRIYHLREQLTRNDATSEHRDSVGKKVEVCLIQHHELASAAQSLVHDVFAGRVKHRIYRQFKMYNDPQLNPQMYNAQCRAA